jgi:hypothetical protein
MTTILTEEKCVNIDGSLIAKNAMIVTEIKDGVRLSFQGWNKDVIYQDCTIDGSQVENLQELLDYAKENLFSVGGGSGGGAVERVTGDLVTGTPTNPVVDLPDWVNQIKNGRFTNFRTITGVSNLLASDAGCLIFSGHISGEPFNNELIFNDNTLEVQERFVILNEYPIKLTGSNDTTVIAPDGYLAEASGNGQMVWVVKTDTGTFYAFGDGLKRDDVNDKMVMVIDSDSTAVPMPLGVKHLTNVGGFPAFANGVHVATAMNSTTQTGLLSFVKFNNAAAEAGTFPMYGTGGVLKVANGVANKDAVNVDQLNSRTVDYILWLQYTGVTGDTETVKLDTGITGIAPVSSPQIAIIPISQDALMYYPVTEAIYNNTTGEITFNTTEVSVGKTYKYCVLIKKV